VVLSLLLMWWKVSSLVFGLVLLVNYLSIIGSSWRWIVVCWLMLLVSVVRCCRVLVGLWYLRVSSCVDVVLGVICIWLFDSWVMVFSSGW